MTITSTELPTWDHTTRNTRTIETDANGSAGDSRPTDEADPKSPVPDTRPKNREARSNLPHNWRPLDDDVRNWGNV